MVVDGGAEKHTCPFDWNQEFSIIQPMAVSAKGAKNIALHHIDDVSFNKKLSTAEPHAPLTRTWPCLKYDTIRYQQWMAHPSARGTLVSCEIAQADAKASISFLVANCQPPPGGTCNTASHTKATTTE